MSDWPSFTDLDTLRSQCTINYDITGLTKSFNGINEGTSGKSSGFFSFFFVDLLMNKIKHHSNNFISHTNASIHINPKCVSYSVICTAHS